MFIAIGSSPSSGSTFLSDLLDSTDVTAVAPELNLFGLKQLYNIKQFKKNAYHCKSSSVFKTTHHLMTDFLYQWGLDKKRYEQMVFNSNSTISFLNSLKDHYLSLRGKNLNSVLFEKSPININAIKKYLNYYDQYFIHIVRNPIYSFMSYKKRDISIDLALVSWLVDQAIVFEFLNHPKLILIKYEDLVKNPYKITSDIILKISGKFISQKKIKNKFLKNNSRKLHITRIKTWSSKKSNIIHDGNKKIITDEDIKSLNLLWRLKVGKTYAKSFKISNVSFQKICKKLGYFDDISKYIKKDIYEKKFRFSKKTKLQFFRKWMIDYRYRRTSFNEVNAYLNPIEFIK